jgi:predicted MPP superfamily phosphohydrolase
MRWIIFLVIYLLVDLYAFQVLKSLTKNHWIYIGFAVLSLLVLGNFIYHIVTYDSSQVVHTSRALAIGLLLVMFIPKLLVIPFVFGEDIVRFTIASYQKLFGAAQDFHLPSRRKFVSTIALTVAAIPFTSLLYGMYRGKYNYKVLHYELAFDDLPEAFDGYQITHLSDIHCGSLDDKNAIAYAVDLINEQKSNAILFTGDLVNDRAEEIDVWKSQFSKLSAKDGVFSVLGNHDYGDYVRWNSQTEKHQNFENIKALQGEMGWKLLLNHSHFIEKNGERIALVGVENWGEGGFIKAGDINKAAADVSTTDFKIVMSHDPSHWSAELLSHPKNFQLTLSGHTHGMQFGIEIPGLIKWSPVKYRYEQWAGIYEQGKKVINVNRGFGFIGYPGRVGIWPEISVITLKRNSATT